ncbi:MAG: HAD-IC family P-type ATPase, partial [Bacilli bacterium]
EGLPMMITLVLSSNMKRMLKSNVLVRKLVGIETAGSINILFTDKTGTLTKGKLEVVGFMSGGINEYKNEQELYTNRALHSLVKLSIVENNASSYTSDKKIVGGNITDRALLNFIKSTNDNEVEKISNIVFSSERKYSSTIVRDKKWGLLNLIKGSPEIILPRCSSYYSEFGTKLPGVNIKEINKLIDSTTRRGIRVIAFAINNNYHVDNLDNLTFLGLAFIKDDIRKEAIKGIGLVKSAGIETVMITGDNKETACAIGKEVGLITSDDDLVLTGSELKLLSDQKVMELLPKLKIVARSLPADKSRLVKLSEQMGLVVGMTGDGVNDAPALKSANVGFAMGSGTEVAKEASEIVILDDNFLSIAKAILFGRTTFKSIRKFIIFQLTVNFCAIFLSIIGPFIGAETPVTVIQMLWINMIMDTLAGIAFAYEPPLEEYMKEPPKKKKEAIINKYMLGEILFTGLYSSLLCLFFLKSSWIHELFRMDNNNKYLMTAFFGLFIFMGIFNCFNARTNRLNLLSHLYQNKIFMLVIAFILVVQVYLIYFGGTLFRTFGLTLKEFEIMILLAATVIPVDFIRKIWLRLRKEKLGV